MIQEHKIKRMMKQSIYSFKQLLSGGLLCCAILLAAYIFQAFFPEMYVDAFSSSIHLSMWLTLFVGALLWTFREREAHGIPSEITDWQCIAAFLLITADQIYVVMPKEIHQEVALALSTYTIPTLVVVGILIAGIIKYSISLYQKLQNERQQSIIQSQKLQQLLASPLSTQRGISLVRKLIENKSIAQLSAQDYLSLVEGCRTIDPDFFCWLKSQNFQLPPRDIVLCVLIRMYKTKEEILSVLCVSDGSYRTMRSRARKRLGIVDKELEAFFGFDGYFYHRKYLENSVTYEPTYFYGEDLLDLFMIKAEEARKSKLITSVYSSLSFYLSTFINFKIINNI